MNLLRTRPVIFDSGFTFAGSADFLCPLRRGFPEQGSAGPPSGTYGPPATFGEGRQWMYGAIVNAGCGVPPSRRLRPRQSRDRRHSRPGRTDDAALFRWAAEVMERRLDRDRPLWEIWIVDGLAAQPLGDPDEGPPLHRRRNRGDAYARPALRRRWRRHVRDRNPGRPRTGTGWTATAGAHAQPHRLDRRSLAHIARRDNRRGAGAYRGRPRSPAASCVPRRRRR